ncbi:MAG TPA: GNAT family N-acetyltransferase [Burkholderiales bacterium]|nr:GNAT family N-acetyltransferase [Burkholderiales bacterium]
MRTDLGPGIKARQLAPRDLDRVVTIDAALGGRSRRAYFERRLAAARLDPEHHLQFAAEDELDLTGFALARMLAGEFGRNRPALMLEIIGVTFPRRGQGIGRRLLETLETEARRRSITELWTQASWRQDRMLKFLARAGFALASPQLLECPVHAGAYGVGAEPPASGTPAEAHRETDYGASTVDEFDKLARDLHDVRSMAKADLDAIVNIDRKLTGRERRAYMEHKLGEALGDSAVRVSLTARCEDSIAGFAMARMDYGDFGRPEPVAVLDTLGVDPDYARRGIGAALLSQLFVNLAALGIEAVETTVAHNDFELLGFLYKAGFGPSERLAFVKPLA